MGAGAVADEAFAGFVRGTQRRVVHFAELLTRDRGRAEDLAQHAYSKAYASWGKLAGGDPEAYVRRCIVNAHTDWWRRRSWIERPSSAVPESVDAAVEDPARGLSERDAVLHALAKLTERERAVIALRYYLDMTEVQIAAELGLRPGTVKSTAARALAKLRADVDLKLGAM